METNLPLDPYLLVRGIAKASASGCLSRRHVELIVAWLDGIIIEIGNLAEQAAIKLPLPHTTRPSSEISAAVREAFREGVLRASRYAKGKSLWTDMLESGSIVDDAECIADALTNMFKEAYTDDTLERLNRVMGTDVLYALKTECIDESDYSPISRVAIVPPYVPVVAHKFGHAADKFSVVRYFKYETAPKRFHIDELMSTRNVRKRLQPLQEEFGMMPAQWFEFEEFSMNRCRYAALKYVLERSLEEPPPDDAFVNNLPLFVRRLGKVLLRPSQTTI